MNNPYLVDRFREIDAAIKQARASSAGDHRLQASLASYLVVLIAGYYEDSVEHLVEVRAGKSGDTDVQNFVRECVHRSFRNPNFEQINELIGHFSGSYKKALAELVNAKARTAINSIVTQKNNLAHGKPVTVTLGDVETYHNSSKPIFEALETLLE